MNHVSFQTLTWGTVSAAIASAMLLAAAGDEAAAWRFEPPAAGPRPAADRPGSRSQTPVLKRLAQPQNSASAADSR